VKTKMHNHLVRAGFSLRTKTPFSAPLKMLRIFKGKENPGQKKDIRKKPKIKQTKNKEVEKICNSEK